MTGRSASALGRSVRPRWRVGVEDAVVADAAEHLCPATAEVVAHRDRVVAGVEDEQRHLVVTGQQPDETAELVDGGIRRIRQGRDAAHVDRRRPAVRRPRELADPLVVPPRDDRLAGRVLGGGVVKAPFGAALRVTALEGRGVDGEDHRPAAWAMSDEEATKAILVDPAVRERLVEAAMAPRELRLERERGNRADRSGGAQRCVAEFEERVGPRRERGVEPVAERDERAARGGRDTGHVLECYYSRI